MALPSPHLRLRCVPVIAAVTALLGAREALAQTTLSRAVIRVEAGAGPMLPDLQRDALGYDTAHAQLTGRVGFDVLDGLSLQASVNNGFFVASGQQSTGRTLALQLGLRVQPAVRAIGRAWADVNPGYYSTGTDRRLGLDAGLGFEFNVAPAVALGPFTRLHWIPADTAIHEASDAVYLSVGVSLTLRAPPRSAPVTAPVAAPVAPAPDADADGLDDSEDQCVNVPSGPSPDPARRGCPRVDQDGDGVFDADDPCPTVPAGARPDPTRRGCPISDRDHDDIPDEADRCPEQPETVNGRDDADGCPESAAPATRPGGRIRMSEQIRFRTRSAEIRDRRSFAIIDAIAGVMRSSPDIVMLHVEGYTDERGDAERNLALSNQRAQSVVRELTARGVEASRLTAHGYGRDRPVVTGGSRRARSANRRIEFRVDLDGSAPQAARASLAPP